MVLFVFYDSFLRKWFCSSVDVANPRWLLMSLHFMMVGWLVGWLILVFTQIQTCERLDDDDGTMNTLQSDRRGELIQTRKNLPCSHIDYGPKPIMCPWLTGILCPSLEELLLVSKMANPI